MLGNMWESTSSKNINEYLAIFPINGCIALGGANTLNIIENIFVIIYR